MRKSCAPSQFQKGAKKPRFVPPSLPFHGALTKGNLVPSPAQTTTSKSLCVDDCVNINLQNSGNEMTVTASSEKSSPQSALFASGFSEVETTVSVPTIPKLSGPKLSGPNLSGPKLSGPYLPGPKLSGPNLFGPNLSGPCLSRLPLLEAGRTDKSGEGGGSGRQMKVFRPPSTSKHSNSAVLKPADSLSNVEDRYYSVVWCKQSRKKHKTWEGDAVLAVRGRSVKLFDAEGKVIGQGQGYKASDLELSEGQTLPVGGKEVEIMKTVSREDFSAGRCFQSSGSTLKSAEQTDDATVNRPAVKPFRKHAVSATPDQNPVVPRRTTCIFDPSAPDALVMPRPPPALLKSRIGSTTHVTDVVVDPYISSMLRPHQRDGISFLYECVMGYKPSAPVGAILADEMGLGKTVQLIALIWTLLKQGPFGGKPVTKRVLIVTPGSIVKNWYKEFNKWLGKERVLVFDVSSDNKPEEFVKSPIYPVMIISYEMLLRSMETIRGIRFDLLVCDEAHRLKNANIKTTTCLSELGIRRRVLLTGTPIQNDLQEFYALADFSNPGWLGSSSSFRRVYEQPMVRAEEPGCSEEESHLGAERRAELTRLTSSFILRRTSAVNKEYLPPKCEYVVFCRPCPSQIEAYRGLLRTTHLVSLDSTYGAEGFPQHLVWIGELKKICNHPALLSSSTAAGLQLGETTEDSNDAFSVSGVNFGDSGKLRVLKCMLRALHSPITPPEKIVLVSNYTKTLSLLQKLCDSEGYSCLRLDGQTPVNKRMGLVDQFNSPFSRATVFLLSSKAGGVGLNLVGASRLVLYDIDWNPANDLQAMARVWRDGQKKNVSIYRLLTTGTIEEKVFQRQVAKQCLGASVVDTDKRAGSMKFSTDDLKDLFSWTGDMRSCDTHQLMDCKCLLTEETQRRELPAAAGSSCRALDGNASRKKVPTALKESLGKSELNNWQHVSSDLLDDAVSDELLLSAKEDITFLFINRSNNN